MKTPFVKGAVDYCALNSVNNESLTSNKYKQPESLTTRIQSAANGNWLFILQALGIPASTLDGRHHPCPACGGDDRFQFTTRGFHAEYGRYSCRAHPKGGGNGFSLVMHYFGCSFQEAKLKVGRVLGIAPYDNLAVARPVPSRVNQTVLKPTTRDETAKREALFNSCMSICATNTAGTYLQRRGLDLSFLPPNVASPLRYCPNLDYWYQDKNTPLLNLGRFPALVAKVLKPNGSLAGVHRIYLNNDGSKLTLIHPSRMNQLLPAKKFQPVHAEALTGSACRLYDVAYGCLALTEGIETALAVYQMTNIPVWACLSAGGLCAVVLPDYIREVIIYADNDPINNFGRNVGLYSAEQLAKRLMTEGRAVKIMSAPQVGQDWLDVLNQINLQVSRNHGK